jgi:hypothetical protein
VSSGVLDGDFYGHPKTIHAWGLHHSSIGVWALAVSYAHEHSTGGVVSAAFVKERLPNKREREQVVAALTSVAPGERNALWSPVEGGWQIHNFGKRAAFHTVEEMEAISEARSLAGRKGAEKRWQTNSKPPSNLPPDLPSPLPQGAIDDKERKALRAMEERPELLSLCDRLAMAICQNDPKANVAPRSKRWLDAARLLLDQDHRTIEEVEHVIDWCQADEFWRPNIVSMGKLRKQFTQLLLKSRQQASNGPRRESPSDLLRAIGVPA